MARMGRARKSVTEFIAQKFVTFKYYFASLLFVTEFAAHFGFRFVISGVETVFGSSNHGLQRAFNCVHCFRCNRLKSINFLSSTLTFNDLHDWYTAIQWFWGWPMSPNRFALFFFNFCKISNAFFWTSFSFSAMHILFTFGAWFISKMRNIVFFSLRYLIFPYLANFSALSCVDEW